MRILWRALPDLALPLALGLALAYLGTGFVPRPEPSLRPPEDLRARGLGYAEESPVRAMLERNVLALETTVFEPQGAPPRPEQAPAAAQPGPQGGSRPGAPGALPTLERAPQAAFAPLDPAMKAPGAVSATAPLSGGPAVQGRIASPAAPSAPHDAAPAQPQIPAQALPEAQKQRPAQGETPARNEARPAPTEAKPEPSPAPKPAPSLAGIRLVGVIAGGGKPLAMLSVDGQALSLEPGASVRGWTLQSVEPGRILLRSGEHVRALTLGGQQPGQ